MQDRKIARRVRSFPRWSLLLAFRKTDLRLEHLSRPEEPVRRHHDHDRRAALHGEGRTLRAVQIESGARVFFQNGPAKWVHNKRPRAPPCGRLRLIDYR